LVVLVSFEFITKPSASGKTVAQEIIFIQISEAVISSFAERVDW
jgi:hypothetical protein